MTCRPVHTKHLNTPRLVADDTQTTDWKWEQQEPFGVNAANDDPDGNAVAFEFNLRLPGQYFDKEANAHYNYFRDYDPAIGRYVQSDPIGLQGGLNTYMYALSDPLNATDPLGLFLNRGKNLPPYFINEFRKQLTPELVEQGGKIATTAQGFGEVVGRAICKATRGRGFGSGTDRCMLGVGAGPGCDGLLAAGYGAVSVCVKACIDEIKKVCNPNCPP